MPNSTTTHQSAFMITAIRELDSAVGAHARWLGNFNKSLICGVPADPCVTEENGYHRCMPRTWLPENRSADWTPWASELNHIETLYRSMHAHARDLYERHAQGAPISAREFDDFIESSLRLKFALRALEFHIIDDVCLVDQLTGAWNRSSMFKRLAEEQDRMLRSGQACCLCMMDLDHFKEVNDSYGHIAGDKVLQGVIDLASRRLRAYDAVFRYGGEEFLFCLPNASMDIAAAAMERVRSDIEELRITLRDGHNVGVTASFGIAQLSADVSVEESIEEADRALLCAKAGGRNRVCRWDMNQQ